MTRIVRALAVIVIAALLVLAIRGEGPTRIGSMIALVLAAVAIYEGIDIGRLFRRDGKGDDVDRSGPARPL